RTRTTPARTRQPASELPGGPATSAAPVSPHGGPGRLHAYGAAAVPPGPSVARTVRDVRACAGPLRAVELGRRLARAGSPRLVLATWPRRRPTDARADWFPTEVSSSHEDRNSDLRWRLPRTERGHPRRRDQGRQALRGRVHRVQGRLARCDRQRLHDPATPPGARHP